MDDKTKPKPTSIEPYRLGGFAKGEVIDFLTTGNVSIPLSIELLKGIVSVKQGDPEPTKTELVMFANAVIEQNCNCYLNECWLVFIRGKYVPIIAAQKRIAKAQSIPSYDGYEWGWIDKSGQRWPSGPENKVKEDDIFGAWGRIYFKNRKVPFYHEIFRSEYKYPRSERKITMLLKTLRDQLHRYAFANEMGNLCTENEPYEEPLSAPESDVLPRNERRLPVPSSEVDTTRAPVRGLGTGKDIQEAADRLEEELWGTKKAGAKQLLKDSRETLTPEDIEKIGAAADGEAVRIEGKEPEPAPSAEEKPKLDTSTLHTTIKEGDNIPLDAAEPSIEEKGDAAALYIEVNGTFIAQNGEDFREFAAYVLCLDESEIAPSKLTEEQLKQIKAYIDTNGVVIN